MQITSEHGRESTAPSEYITRVSWPVGRDDISYGHTARSARQFVREVTRFYREEGHPVTIRRAYGTDASVTVYEHDRNRILLIVAAEQWEGDR